MHISFKKDGKTITLSQLEVEEIVRTWYTNGMVAELLQDCHGRDLEELVTDQFTLKIKTHG